MSFVTTSTPAAQGVAAPAVDNLVTALERQPGADPHSLMVLRHGHVVAAGWWRPYSPERTHLLYSLSKSFTVTAAALAMADGLLGLDDPVVAHFPELDGPDLAPASSQILVRHLASMSTGHTYDTWEAAKAADPADPVRGFLSLPPERAPGSLFTYNQSATYTLGAIVQRIYGRTLRSLLWERLLGPMGADRIYWEQYPEGRDMAFSGLYATTRTIALLGQLYLEGGRWAGEQVLPPDWVAIASRPHVATAGVPGAESRAETPDWLEGYGTHFWMSRHGYRGDGAYGQLCLVLPEHDAVVAVTSQSDDIQYLLDAVWEHLLPGLHPEPLPPTTADDALARRLSGLVVPGRQEGKGPPDGAVGRGTGAQAGPLEGLRQDGPGDGPPAAEWVSVELTHEVVTDEPGPLPQSVVLSNRDGLWCLTLREPGWETEVVVGMGEWAVAEPGPGTARAPTAGVGRWETPDILRTQVIFLETPHRMELYCDVRRRVFQARWVTNPLFVERLQELCPHRDLVP